MKLVRIMVVPMLLAGLSFAQVTAQTQEAKDLLTTIRANHSLSLFDSAITSSGFAKMLRQEGPFTVFAVSNQAFANLHKDDLRALLASPPAMHMLLTQYIAPGTVAKDDTSALLSVQTLSGLKLRTDITSDGSYVNGAKLSQSEIRCTNGMIHVLDSFHPGLVRNAVALANASGREK